MSRFLPLAYFQKPLEQGYKLLPLRFAPLNADEVVITNQAGEWSVISRRTLNALVRHQLSYDDPEYDALKAKHFLIDNDSDVALDLLALKVRTKLQHLSTFTALHIFVVTLRCEHSCPYCQVSRQSDDRLAYDMSKETAEKALAIVFRSPSPAIKIEFQGGEPLLNFELIRYIVLRAKEINEIEKRDLQFVIATNLAVVTDEMLLFCKEHDILISTSLDGPRDIHNKNRPRPGGDSYERAIAGIKRAREVLGHDRVGALMTTTVRSLSYVNEIIDEYVSLGFEGIFLRPLSPYGFAIKTRSFAAYNRDAWLRFYKDGLAKIIELNKSGIRFVEFYAATILTKMLTPSNPGYVDLMSPAGIGIAAMVYNYDGDVYASDEGRMLAEMGDKKFRLGNLHRDSYEDIVLSDALLNPIEESYTGCVPMCSECAFEPFCGADPVYHYATQGDVVGRKPTSDFCSRNTEIFKHLIELMRGDRQIRAIFQTWATR